MATFTADLPFIDVEMAIESRAMEARLRAYARKWYGEACRDYDADCACCKAWALVESFTKFDSYCMR